MLTERVMHFLLCEIWNYFDGVRLHASGYTTGRNHVGFYLPVFARKGDKERKKQMVWLAFLFKFQTCTLEFPYFVAPTLNCLTWKLDLTNGFFCSGLAGSG